MHPAPKSHRTPFGQRRAFTLIELLTVVAIVGILAAILIPVVNSVKQSAKATTCLSNVRQVASAVHLFVADNKGFFPGSGQKPTSSSASWMDVVNVTVFQSEINASRQTLQRLGPEPVGNQIYCPSMEPFKNVNPYARAYVMNVNTQDFTAPKVTWGILSDYQRGVPINRFARPASTLLLLESEKDSDNVGPTAPLNQIVMGDGNATPAWSANSLRFAFRHKGRMNVAFIDGHVESIDTDRMAKLNNNAGFTPDGT